MHKVLTDSVQHLLKHIPSTKPDQLPLMLDLIDGRRRTIQKELEFERMLGVDTLPPLLVSMYSLEFLFEESEVVRTYTRLLEKLSDAEQTIRAKMRDLNPEPPASDL